MADTLDDEYAARMSKDIWRREDARIKREHNRTTDNASKYAKEIMRLEAALATAQRDADHFYQYSGRLLNQLHAAHVIINLGVELMTPEQVGQWSGVRAWLEQGPEDYEPLRALAKEE